MSTEKYVRLLLIFWKRTTENDMTHIKEAITSGANEYIMKPFDSEIIASKFSQAGLL